VTTNDAGTAELLRVLRVHGSKPKYYHSLIGGNFRFDSIQAAIVTVKLKYLDQWTAGRQANAARYRKLFAEAGLLENGRVQLPYEAPGNRHIYNQFIIRVQRRNEVQAFLRDLKIGNEIYYPVPLHLQECFAYVGNHKGDFPHSEAAADETLALPIYSELSDQQAAYVVNSIAKFFAK
jgi:dTDP-4-amino-4,6-dideoxygalactose transaminase